MRKDKILVVIDNLEAKAGKLETNLSELREQIAQLKDMLKAQYEFPLLVQIRGVRNLGAASAYLYAGFSKTAIDVGGGGDAGSILKDLTFYSSEAREKFREYVLAKYPKAELWNTHYNEEMGS